MRNVSFYSANCLQNFLISCFAPLRQGAFVMFKGALFHSLAISLLKLILADLVLASSFQSLVCSRSHWSIRVYPIWVKHLHLYRVCVDFHASVSLISAANWFTDGILYFVSNEAVVMWSFNEVRSSILSILFWVFWIRLICLFVGSSFDLLTWLQSWRP